MKILIREVNGIHYAEIQGKCHATISGDSFTNVLGNIVYTYRETLGIEIEELPEIDSDEPRELERLDEDTESERYMKDFSDLDHIDP